MSDERLPDQLQRLWQFLPPHTVRWMVEEEEEEGREWEG